MKIHRKLIVTFAILIALGIVGTAIAVTYYPHTPITDVGITGTLSDGDSVAISSDHTMTCTTSTDTDKYCDDTGWHYPSDPVTHTWSGPGTFDPTTGTSVTWTAPSTTGDKTITVTADDSPLYNETAKTDSITVTVVKVDKLQYNDPVSGYTDISGTLYACKGTTITFKAIPNPSGASWPSGKPVWGGTSGASGTGETKSVTFNTLSTSTSDYKTVTAECGNTITANVIVFDFDGVLTPQDPFYGRSQSKYGLEEKVNLSCDIDPSGLTAGTVGGLKWTKHSGVGSVSNQNTSAGTAVYDAGESAGGVMFYLIIQSGPSKGWYKTYWKTVIAPSGTRMTRVTANVRHFYGIPSAGIKLYYWLDPTDVSFTNLDFGEGSCPTTNASGYFTQCYPNYPGGGPLQGHAQNTFGDIRDGDIGTGCRVELPDYASAGADTVLWAAGSYTWSIPTQYIDDTSTRNTFGSNQNHVGTIQASGYTTISKGGQSGSAALNAPNSGW